jgi:AmmeMemoRadiSam system protein A
MPESDLVKLARATIETIVRTGKILATPDPLPEEMKKRAGVFVSLKKRGELRGCIGTFAPTTQNLAEEIVRNAIESARHDPRFAPVRADELSLLEISVDVLTPPEPVESMADLDAKKYGVIVKSGMRRGLLLPDLPGVDTPKQQIEICRAKGGIAPEAPVELFRFEVKRYH